MCAALLYTHLTHLAFNAAPSPTAKRGKDGKGSLEARSGRSCQSLYDEIHALNDGRQPLRTTLEASRVPECETNKPHIRVGGPVRCYAIAVALVLARSWIPLNSLPEAAPHRDSIQVARTRT